MTTIGQVKTHLCHTWVAGAEETEYALRWGQRTGGEQGAASTILVTRVWGVLQEARELLL